MSTESTSSAGVPCATTRPRSMMTSRSHRRSASSMKCVTSRIVTPRSRTRSTSSHVARRAAGSSPVVSSSRIATRGFPTSASAIDRRCFCPPESLANATRRCPARSSRSRSSSTSPGDA
ncbi:Uncharacterised protein [Mycobacteroides abscessus]|nr:Uncharacterised protein [Mycobacteroides abscessus]